MNVDDIKQGMRVKICNLIGTTGMLIVEKHLLARSVNKTGIIRGYVPGHGGDVWWVEHDDGTVGAYNYEEFEEYELVD